MGPRRRSQTPAPNADQPGLVQEVDDAKNSMAPSSPAVQGPSEHSSADPSDEEEKQEGKQRECTPDTEDASGTGSDEENRSEEEGTTEEDRRKRLRGDWRFAALLHFCRLFSNTFQWGQYGSAPGSRIRDKGSLSADKLESALLDPRSNLPLVGDLVYRLAHRCELYNTTYQERKRTTPLSEQDVQDKWQAAIIKWAHQHWHRDIHTRNPLHKGRSFLDVSASTRLDASEALSEAIKATVEDSSLRADVLRLEPLGMDARGNRFFHLSESHEDCWLFREAPPKVKGKGGRMVDDQDPAAQAGWTTECTTLEELKAFASKMSGSRSLAEKEVGARLEEDILPPLAAAVEAQRKAEERALLYELAPKKRSGRVAQIVQKKEEEERQRQQEREERAREKARLKEERAEKARQAAAEKRKAIISGSNYLAPPTKKPRGPSRDERLAMRAHRRATSAAPSSGGEDGRTDEGGDGEDGAEGATQAAGADSVQLPASPQQQQGGERAEQGQGQQQQQQQLHAGQAEAAAQELPNAGVREAATGTQQTETATGHVQAPEVPAGHNTHLQQVQAPVQAGSMAASQPGQVHYQEQAQPHILSHSQQQTQPTMPAPQQHQHPTAMQGAPATSTSGPDSQRLLQLLRQSGGSAGQPSNAESGSGQVIPQQQLHQQHALASGMSAGAPGVQYAMPAGQMAVAYPHAASQQYGMHPGQQQAPSGFQQQVPVYMQQQVQAHNSHQQYIHPQQMHPQQGMYGMQQYPAQQQQQQQQYLMQMHPQGQPQQHQPVYVATTWNGNMQGMHQHHMMQMPQ